MLDRTRSRNTLVGNPAWRMYRASEYVMLTRQDIGGFWGSSGEVSSIDDSLPYFKRGVIGLVDHTKKVLAPWPETLFIDGLVELYWTGSGYAIGSQRPITYHRSSGSPMSEDFYNLQHEALLPAPSFAGLATKAINRLSELSVLNSIWESREIPALFGPKSIIGRILPALTVIRKRQYREVFKQLPRFIHKGKFQWKAFRSFALGKMPQSQLEIAFGWVPTVNEALSLPGGLQRAWKKRLKQKGIVVSNVVKDESVQTLASDSMWNVVVRKNREARACLMVIPTPPPAYYTQFFASLDGFARQIMRHPASTIWEAIPFSFLVDWFISVDKMIDNAYLYRYSDMRTVCWSSAKSVATRTGTLRVPTRISDPSSGLLAYESITLPEDRSSRYVRRPGDLPPALQEAGSRFNPYKGFLAALLALGLTPKSIKGI